MDCSLPPSSVLEWIAKEVGSKPMFVGSWMARTARQRVSCVLCELGGAQSPCIRELHGQEHQVSQALLTGSVKTQSRNRCSELSLLFHCVSASIFMPGPSLLFSHDHRRLRSQPQDELLSSVVTQISGKPG